MQATAIIYHNHIVTLLEEKLEKAKRGEYSAVGFIAIHKAQKDGIVTSFAVNAGGCSLTLLGGVARLSNFIQKDLDEMVK